jgi:signal transduction histidine kinase
LKQFVTLLAFYFTINCCSAQDAIDTSKVFITNLSGETSLFSKTQIFIDSASNYSLSEILQQPFIPLDKFSRRAKISKELMNRPIYLKFQIGNTSKKIISGYFFPGVYYSQMDLYKPGMGMERITNTGNISGYKKLTLAAGEVTTCMVKLKMVKNDFNYIDPQFINAVFFDKYRSHIVGQKSDIQIYGLILSGVLFMMILFMITNYIVSRKPEFIYNALYSTCMFLLIFLNSILVRTTTTFSELYYSYFDFFLLVLGTVFYIAFTRKFLNTKSRYKLLDKVFQYGEQFVLLLLVVYTFLNFFTKTYLPQYYLENLMKILILGIGITFIYLAFKQHDNLFNYIALGNAGLIFFSLISLSLILLGIKPHSFFYSSIVHYNTGIVIELAFFLLGLTYKNRYELILGIQQQEALKLEAEKQEFENRLTVINAQQEVRNRISADMHDDLGAGMTTISLYSELAKRKLIDNPIPEIDKISSSANELLSKMNAIIWSMSSSNDTLSNMIAYIRSYAIEYFEDTGVNCKISIPDKLPNIEVIGEIRRNVFLVVKEALNNILKHAKATEVTINLIRVEDGLTLYIHDNGEGIDFEKLRQFGNGLKNMKKRMQDMDIDFTIENKNGTLITMHRKIITADFF